jgi:hypothetical protein
VRRYDVKQVHSHLTVQLVLGPLVLGPHGTSVFVLLGPLLGPFGPLLGGMARLLQVH